ncbi:MAG: hypothetical protein QM751_07595 [Paludibacteraceae bacterium]
MLLLAKNYGQLGRTFSQGNVDYSSDGLVGFDDLLLLARRYGTTLPAASADVVAIGTNLRRRSGGVWASL